MVAKIGGDFNADDVDIDEALLGEFIAEKEEEQIELIS